VRPSTIYSPILTLHRWTTSAGLRPGARLAGIDWTTMASAPLPHITPMAPTFVAQPFHRAGWVYEEKVDGLDGYRMAAMKAGDGTAVASAHDERFSASAGLLG
jgi:hypothetical protein